MAEYGEAFCYNLPHFTHPHKGHGSSSRSTTFRKRKFHNRDDDDDDLLLLEEDEGPSTTKKFVSEEQMSSYLQQLNLVATVPPPCPPPHRVTSSDCDLHLRQPSDYMYITSSQEFTDRNSFPSVASESSVYDSSRDTRDKHGWSEESCQEVVGHGGGGGSGGGGRVVSPTPPKTLDLARSDFHENRSKKNLHSSLDSIQIEATPTTPPSASDSSTSQKPCTGDKEKGNGQAEDSFMAEIERLKNPLSSWRRWEISLEDGSSDSSDGGVETPERPLSIWIALELQNCRKEHLLPPSIVKELHKPKGMEMIPWVDPNKVLKPLQSQATHQETVMEEQAIGGHSVHGMLYSMESIEEESEDECSEMEP